MSERWKLIEPARPWDECCVDWRAQRVGDGQIMIIDPVTGADTDKPIDPASLAPGAVIECEYTFPYSLIASEPRVVTEEPTP